MKHPALHTHTDTQRPADPRRVPEELKPFLDELARMIAADVLSEEAARQSKSGRGASLAQP